MCDFCSKPCPVNYEFPYYSKQYQSLIVVRLCDDCAVKVKKAGGITKYLEENKHE